MLAVRWANSALSDVDTFTSWTSAIPGKDSSEHCPEPQVTDFRSFSSGRGENRAGFSEIGKSDAFSITLRESQMCYRRKQMAKSCLCRVIIHCKCCPVLSVSRKGRLLVCLEGVVLLGIALLPRPEGAEDLGGHLVWRGIQFTDFNIFFF